MLGPGTTTHGAAGMDQIPLAEMLVGLRKELLEAQRQAENEKLKFKIDDIEVELRVGTTKTGVVKGGVKFWVVDASAEGEIDAQRFQTVRLKLTPVAEGGGETLISDRDTK